jgi:hypothetical protein
VLFGAVLVWEGLGLTIGEPWPTLSHMLRTVTRPLAGRLVLFGVWLWIGWHLFVRGWTFFLRGPLPELPAPSRGGGMTLSQLWQHAILPLAGIYWLFVAMLSFAVRRPVVSRDAGGVGKQRATAWWRSILGVALTVGAGYGVFITLIGAYVVFAGRNPADLLGHAVTGGALLAFIVVLPGFLLLSMAAALKRRPRRIGRRGLP